MSIKDLFQNNKTSKIHQTETLASASAEVEGISLIHEKTKEKVEFVPPIDFSTASNFAKFGSAELYYEYAFNRVQQQYPYDGTLAERQQYENSSSYLDRYIFNNLYPRTNGFVNFGINTAGGSKGSDGYYTGATNKEYIYVLGGPHTASAGMTGKKLNNTFDLSTIYDASNKRENNLKIDLTVGNSVEFWLKKTGFDSTIASKEVIYDVTNGDNKHFRIFLSASTDGTSPINVEFATTATTSSYSLAATTVTTASVSDSAWHHYAITMLSQSTGIKTRLFVDSVLSKEQTVSSPWDDIKTSTNGVIASIGAKVVNAKGDGQLLSASMDEFRFWKSERTGKQIGQNWFVNLGGGTDDSLDNIDLGVYFKFNEGITTVASTDSTILDYSGRLSNGQFTGYTSTTRNTGSAIILSGITDREYKDPIIYSSHPSVSAKKTELMELGAIADDENTSLFYHLLPSWLIENDTATSKNIKYLCQIMASYFDTLHAQISYMNKIKDEKYFGPVVEKDDFTGKHYLSFSDQDKPFPFSQQLLRHRGFIVPNLLVEANLVEEFLEHDVNEKYDRDLTEVKNLIYQNLYNNIIDIYKTKGTEKSFQRYLKNFGVDSDLVKLNLYADRAKYTLRDNYEYKAVKTNGANFNNADNTAASVYQNSGSDGVGYIKNPNDGTKYSAYSLEAEVLFPRQPNTDSSDYYEKSFTTGSIVGFHRIDPTVDEYTFHSTDKTLKVLVASTANREHSQFIVTGSDGIRMTSSVIPNLYDEQKWNFALRVKNSKYPLSNITGAIDAVTVDVDFYAVCTEDSTIYNTVTMSTSSIANGELYLSSSKKIFAGAEKTNFTGSSVTFSDVVVTDVKYWQSYINNEEVNQHAFDSEAFGVRHPLENDSIFSVNNVSVPQKDTLAFHWDFENNTASDGTGGFTVYDASSGSSGMTSRYGWLSEITKNKHYGQGIGFLASSNKAFDKIYLSTARRRIPSSIYTSDMITVKSGSNEVFIQDDEVVDNFYAFEKSMQAVISDEVVKMFASVAGFNNLIGQPENKYRPSYKDIDYLRQQFFESIENEPDQEKFFEFYKWIDDSISFGMKQLCPASARFSDGILNVIESHILERPKHQNKFPMLSPSSPEAGQIMGGQEQGYQWAQGHAPNYKTLSNLNNVHCTWQAQRKEDTSSDENNIRRVVNTKRPMQKKVLRKADGTFYYREQDVKSFRHKPYKFDATQRNTIHGGINYEVNKNREVYKEYIRPHGPINEHNIPRNIFAVGIGAGQGIVSTKQCDDVTNTILKKKLSFDMLVGKNSDQDGDHPLDDAFSYKHLVKGNHFGPFNLFSASIEPEGYHAVVSASFKTNTLITNLHSDTTDLSNEIPMQGPFTQTHIGGRQSRHLKINTYDVTLKTEGGGATTNNIDDQYSRPEEWRMFFGEATDETIKDGVFALVGPDYGGPYPDPSRQIARWYRDGRTKKHFSIGNIKSNSRLMGNYKNNYEVIAAVGRKENNLRYRSISDTVNFIEPALKTELSDTTVNASLVAQKASIKGNIVGADSNLFRTAIAAFRTPEEAGNHNDNTATKSIIVSKFSAPGAFETSTRIFMDGVDGERSVYNALPFRNLTVRSSGSGELSYTRTDTHINKREGLQTMLRRHLGRFGVDPIHGPSHPDTDSEGIASGSYNILSNRQKQHRNNHWKNKEFEITCSVPSSASGSFSVRGISYSGSFATGSFTVTGSTIYGIEASGSFAMSGAYYGGNKAQASFRVEKGRTINAVAASGSFNVSGAHVAGANASASFDVNSIPVYGDRAYAIIDFGYETANEGDSIEVDREQDGTDQYEIDIDGNGITANHGLITPVTYEKALSYNDTNAITQNWKSGLGTSMPGPRFEASFSTPIPGTSIYAGSSLVLSMYLKAPEWTSDFHKSLFTITGSNSFGETNKDSIEIYFSGSLNGNRNLYVRRHYSNTTTRTAGYQELGPYNYDSLLGTNAYHHHVFWFTDSNFYVHVDGASTANISATWTSHATTYGEAYNPSNVQYHSWDLIRFFGASEGTISQGWYANQMVIDETQLHFISQGGGGNLTEVKAFAKALYNGGSKPPTNLSSSNQHSYYAWGDHGSDSTSAVRNQAASAATLTGILTLEDGAAACNTIANSKFYTKKGATAYFDHVKTALEASSSNFSVNYLPYTLTCSSAIPKQNWIENDHVSGSPPNYPVGQELNFARFFIVSNVRSDHAAYSFNAARPLVTNPPAYSLSQSSMTRKEFEITGTDTRSNIIHHPNTSTVTIDGNVFEIDHVNASSTNTQIATYTLTSSALSWASTSTQQVWAANTSWYNKIYNSDFSFSFWFRKDSPASTDYFLKLLDGTAQQGIVYRSATGISVILYTNNTNRREWKLPDANYEEGDWNHFAFTFTLSSLTGKIYLNGTDQNITPDEIGTFTGLTSELDTIYFGDRDTTSSGYEARADFQDLAFWSGSLDSTEITEVYNQGRVKNLKSTSIAHKLVNWYKMRDGEFDGRTNGTALNTYSITEIPDDGVWVDLANSASVNSLTFNDNSQVTITDGIPTDTIGNETFRSNLSSSIIAVSAITNKVSIVRAGDTFTLTSTGSGPSHNGAVAISTNNTDIYTINNASLVGGVDTGGVQNGHTFVIDGTTFTINAAGTGTTNTAVGASGTDAEFYTRLRTSIINSTDFDAVTTGSGASVTTFSITSSTAQGAADNGVLSLGTGDSFSIVNNTAGGVTQAGATDGDTIVIPKESASGNHTFIIDGTAPDNSDAGDNYYVTSAVATDVDFWDNLKDKVNTVSGFDVNYINNGDATATFHLTASNVGVYTEGLQETGSTFSTLVTFAGGAATSGSIHGHQISIASTTITLKTASVGANDIDISSTRSDAQVWEAMDTLIDSFPNYSSSQVGAGPGISREFLVTHDNTGSGNSPSISSSDSSFGGISNYDGQSQLGADDPHTITIAGVVFELSNEQPAGQQTVGSHMISASAGSGSGEEISNATFWNNISSSMNTNLPNHNVVYVDNGNSTATFSITGSTTGSAKNAAMSTSGGSFTSLNNITGGLEGFSGVVHNDNIRMFNTATSDLRYHIDLSGNIANSSLVGSRGGTTIIIQSRADDLNDITASINSTNFATKNLEFWGRLSASIKDYTGYDDITITAAGDNKSAIFSITSSATGSQFNEDFTIVLTSPTPSFAVVSNPSGGVDYICTNISGSNFKKVYDNFYKNTLLPATDYQYSWTHENVKEEYHPTGSKQYTLRYADASGKILSNGVFYNTLNFPTASIFTLD